MGFHLLMDISDTCVHALQGLINTLQGLIRSFYKAYYKCVIFISVLSIIHSSPKIHPVTYPCNSFIVMPHYESIQRSLSDRLEAMSNEGYNIDT